MPVTRTGGRFPGPYRHVISLGFFCGTALELERYGFRDASYPFDWVICPIKPTVVLLESGMESLMRSTHVVRDSVHQHIVRDLDSGIDFYHDFAPDVGVEDQLDSVREKYARRMLRFRQAIEERTLFVRYIADAEEHRFLSANMDVVMALLRQHNPANDLLLVGNADLPPDCGGSEVFRVEPDVGDSVAREFARKNAKLRRALITAPYPAGLRIRNLARYVLSQHFKDRQRARVRRAVVRIVGEGTLKGLLSAVRRS